MIPEAEARILVVDDEALARDRLRRLLRKYATRPGIDAARTGEEAVKAIGEYEPHLVFLDIQLPDFNGFDVIDAVGPGRMPPVIFVTAYDAYAIRAFDVQAVDYLVKPYTEERFRQAFERACRRRHDAEAEGELQRVLETVEGGQRSPYLRRVMVRSAQEGVLVLRAAEIDWIEAANNYVRLHVGGRTHVLREKLSSMQARLDPQQFARIHRSLIVNLDRIVRMRPWYSGDYRITLEDGTEVRMSRTYREVVQRQLGGGVDLSGL